jgi:hypothetical protein
MRNDKENVIVIKTFQFALKIVEFSKILEANNFLNLEHPLVQM